MANLEEIIAAKAASDSLWKNQHQADRQAVTEMQDCGIELIVTDPAQYIRYLTMQGDNPAYSAGNVAIVLAGMEKATVFGTRDRWQSLGRTVLPEEQDHGVKIFARDARTKAYSLTDAYDVSQTQGKDLKHRALREDSAEMSSALQTLLNYSKAEPAVDRGLDAPAFFDEDKRELAINPNYTDPEAFASIAAEVALTRYHDKGYNRDYSWARYELDAQSVSYILCRRYGVEPKQPNLERLGERFAGMDMDECKSVLDKIQDMSKQIGRSIDLNIEAERRRSRTTERRPVR
ncbi:hypothetical protein [Flavonifractor sp.]|uniref:hypothetical protein n=1 Tax=Flavonifractor sp. TaxID=2049025 RepID=UPI0025C6508E|nr:hypothetical protein [Flavonifractor sp.]